MWRKCLILVFVALAISMVARANTIYQDTLRRKQVIYDPIDYSTVSRQLQLAARPTLWQRLSTRLRTPLFVDNPATNFRTSGRLG